MTDFDFIHYPPIERHGVIGDRRTAALVAADGTIDWCCVPHYDDDVVFGALLDPEKGGFCRLGPAGASLGEQHYEDASMCLETCWKNDGGKVILTDLMPWPERERPDIEEETRVILRRIRAEGADVEICFIIRPRWTFGEAPRVRRRDCLLEFTFSDSCISLWTSFDVEPDEDGATACFTLPAGEEAWVMIGLNEEPGRWDAGRCSELHKQTNAYWHEWSGGLKEVPEVGGVLRRCAMIVHMLAESPHNAAVAAATTSLPERIGGERNYDYRYTWVRDASISAAFLAVMGEHREVASYFCWLCELDAQVDAPLQVCYRTDGGSMLEERICEGVAGYRGSKPVRFGNRAYKQRQLGSLGWFADSAWIFLEAGGEWRPEFWEMMRRSAEHVCRSWREPDSGVWELVREAHFVASKVMAWVTIDRAMKVAGRIGEEVPGRWDETCRLIREEVLSKGWNERRKCFRQRYDSEAVDAAALLIPLMDFLPPDDPRVLDTIREIEETLVIDDLVHRFVPAETFGGEQLAVGDFEGAFLPATFWYAHALAGAGRTDDARRVLRRCEGLTGCLTIFAEEADARRNEMLGNTPLLFSQVEYGRALLAIHEEESKREKDC